METDLWKSTRIITMALKLHNVVSRIEGKISTALYNVWDRAGHECKLERWWSAVNSCGDNIPESFEDKGDAVMCTDAINAEEGSRMR